MTTTDTSTKTPTKCRCGHRWHEEPCTGRRTLANVNGGTGYGLCTCDRGRSLTDPAAVPPSHFMLERAQDQLSHAERLERAREAEAARRLRVRVSTAIGWSRGVRAARRELLRPVEIFEPAS